MLRQRRPKLPSETDRWPGTDLRRHRLGIAGVSFVPLRGMSIQLPTSLVPWPEGKLAAVTRAVRDADATITA
jgi:hypothetical protein